MPTRTFINLPKEKKLRILKAAKKEFSRVPLEKAIIANIVKDAKIPRGSFYQYFESIEDLFMYLINYMYGVDKKKFIKCMQEANGDFYEALKLNFSNLIDRLAVEENRQFRINTISTLFNAKNEETKEELIATINRADNYIDPEDLPVELKNRKGIAKVLDIIKMISKQCTQRFISNGDNAEEAKHNYNNYIDLVKAGFGNTL